MKKLEEIKNELIKNIYSFFDIFEDLLMEELKKYNYDWFKVTNNFKERGSVLFGEIEERYDNHVKEINEYNKGECRGFDGEKEYDEIWEFCSDEILVYVDREVGDIRDDNYFYGYYFDDVKDERLVSLAKEISDLGKCLEKQVDKQEDELNKLEGMKRNLLIQKDSLRNTLKEKSEELVGIINQIEDVEEQLPKVKKLIKDHLLNRAD